MSLGPETIQAFVDRIENARRVLIGTHLNPDGDALGSALGLSHLLDARGIPNEVLCNNPAPHNLKFLPGVDRVRQAPEETGYELGIVLDLDSMDRLGRVRPFFDALPDLVVIDHHVPHEAPGNLRIVDVEAPATAVILTRLVHAMGDPISPEAATCLLAGIVTDTGSFRFRNTTPESLTLASELLAKGGDIVTVSEEVYQKKQLPSVKLLSRALQRMRLDCDDQIAWASLTTADFEECGALEEHTEGLVNELLAIDTVKIAAIIREPRPGRVRASLRSRGQCDVASVARLFGGGGHRNAAGCTFETPLAVAEASLIESLRTCLESC